MDYLDLRDWIERARELGEVRDVPGASWQEDIGHVTEMLHHTEDAPVALFDEIPGYPQGLPDPRQRQRHPPAPRADPRAAARHRSAAS